MLGALLYVWCIYRKKQGLHHNQNESKTKKADRQGRRHPILLHRLTVLSLSEDGWLRLIILDIFLIFLAGDFHCWKLFFFSAVDFLSEDDFGVLNKAAQAAFVPGYCWSFLVSSCAMVSSTSIINEILLSLASSTMIWNSILNYSKREYSMIFSCLPCGATTPQVPPNSRVSMWRDASPVWRRHSAARLFWPLIWRKRSDEERIAGLSKCTGASVAT